MAGGGGVVGKESRGERGLRPGKMNVKLINLIATTTTGKYIRKSSKREPGKKEVP